MCTRICGRANKKNGRVNYYGLYKYTRDSKRTAAATDWWAGGRRCRRPLVVSRICINNDTNRLPDSRSTSGQWQRLCTRWPVLETIAWVLILRQAPRGPFSRASAYNNINVYSRIRILYNIVYMIYGWDIFFFIPFDFAIFFQRKSTVFSYNFEYFSIAKLYD